MTDEITLDAPETRIERFLAAAAGVEGITLDEPETRIERYLYKIAQGSGGVPPVEDADKGKYLHANESTGALEWAEGGSGGGVLVVTDTDGTLDKTWQEINDADFAVILAYRSQVEAIVHMPVNFCNEGKGAYDVACELQGATVYYTAESTSDYPTLDE